jgi:hypothetical protein
MKRIMSIQEIVDHVELEGAAVEIVAAAGAFYDEENQQLRIELTSTARGGHLEPGKSPLLDWLPASQSVNQRVELEDADSATRDVFHSWTRKIRALAASRRKE